MAEKSKRTWTFRGKKEVSEKVEHVWNRLKTNNGGYLVRSATYNESEFIKFAKENFVAVKITIEVAYSFEKTEVLEVDPF